MQHKAKHRTAASNALLLFFPFNELRPGLVQMLHVLQAFEIWGYCRMLKISCVGLPYNQLYGIAASSETLEIKDRKLAYFVHFTSIAKINCSNLFSKTKQKRKRAQIDVICPGSKFLANGPV